MVIFTTFFHLVFFSEFIQDAIGNFPHTLKIIIKEKMFMISILQETCIKFISNFFSFFPLHIIYVFEGDMIRRLERPIISRYS